MSDRPTPEGCVTCPECGGDWRIFPRNPRCRLCMTVGNIKVASDEECEKADIVVCGNMSHFGDDIHSFCSKCGADIVHRPYVPKAPPKICMECAIPLMKKP